jgi:phage tail sheath protein FI
LQAAIRAAVLTPAGVLPPAFTNAIVAYYGTAAENLYFVVAGGAAPAVLFGAAVADPNTVGDLGLGAGAAQANVQLYALGGPAAGVAGTAQGVGVQGNDGTLPNGNALRGDPNLHTGLYALDAVDLFNILCIPRTGLVGAAAPAPALSDAEATAVITEATNYCQQRRAFFIVDTPFGIDTIDEIQAWMTAHASLRHRNLAIYFPRVMVPDPLDEFRARSFGASGTMAGIFARIDGTRGVWKAPAGLEATLSNVPRLEYRMTDQECGVLNPLGINCLRTFAATGNLVWGARTLVGMDAPASEWKYVPVRRFALFLEESLFRGTTWIVFEPNDEPLWAKIRMNLNAFMMGLFRQGAFEGSTPDKAFYVKCDGETTTAQDRELGIVNIEVGFAPLKPAEFVVIKIQQMLPKN